MDLYLWCQDKDELLAQTRSESPMFYDFDSLVLGHTPQRQRHKDHSLDGVPAAASRKLVSPLPSRAREMNPLRRAGPRPAPASHRWTSSPSAAVLARRRARRQERLASTTPYVSFFPRPNPIL